MKPRTAILWTSALVAAALLLRLHRLGEGLWLDEISTWIRYMRLPLADIPRIYGSENQHVLFSLLARFSMNVFGESAWAFRLPAVLFGAASIAAMYLFAAETASRKEGVLSAALLTFSYHHIWFSQNARGYSGLLFWTLLASWLLVRALKDDTRRLWLFYAASAALGVYTHATMAFVLLAHALIAAWLCQASNRWRGALFGFSLGAALTFLLHAPALPSILAGLRSTVSTVEEWRSPLWTLLELAQGIRVSFAGIIAAWAALILFATGALSFYRTRPVVLALLVLPPVLGSAILLSIGHHVWPRFFYFAFGFGALVVVRGALSVPRVGTALAVAIVAVSALSVPFAYGPKQDFGAARQLILANARPGDAIATCDLATWVYQRFYFDNFTDLRSVDQLNSLRPASGRTWIVYTLEPVFRAQLPQLLEAIRRDTRIVKVFPGTLRAGEVTVCLRETRP